MKKLAFFVCAVVTLTGCTSSVQVIQPKGERGTITCGEKSFEAELLEVSDSAFYLLHQGKLFLVPHNEVSSIEIHGYSLKKAKLVPALTVAGIEVIAIAAALGSDVELKDGAFSFYLFGFPPILAAFAYFTGDPEVNFSPPFEASAREKLRLYSRYPQGLSSDRRRQLLRHYGQNDFQRIGEE